MKTVRPPCKTPFNPSHINCLIIFFLAVETYVFLCIWGKFGITVDKVTTTHPLNHISYFFYKNNRMEIKGGLVKEAFIPASQLLLQSTS